MSGLLYFLRFICLFEWQSWEQRNETEEIGLPSTGWLRSGSQWQEFGQDWSRKFQNSIQVSLLIILSCFPRSSNSELGLEPAPTWNAGISGSRVTHCSVTPVPNLWLLSVCSKRLRQTVNKRKIRNRSTHRRLKNPGGNGNTPWRTATAPHYLSSVGMQCPAASSKIEHTHIHLYRTSRI